MRLSRSQWEALIQKPEKSLRQPISSPEHVISLGIKKSHCDSLFKLFLKTLVLRKSIGGRSSQGYLRVRFRVRVGVRVRVRVRVRVVIKPIPVPYRSCVRLSRSQWEALIQKPEKSFRQPISSPEHVISLGDRKSVV